MKIYLLLNRRKLRSIRVHGHEHVNDYSIDGWNLVLFLLIQFLVLIH